MTKHKWATEIHAWANGSTIEVLIDPNTWTVVRAPQWQNPVLLYRIKPTVTTSGPNEVETVRALNLYYNISQTGSTPVWSEESLKGMQRVLKDFLDGRVLVQPKTALLEKSAYKISL